MFNKNFNNKKGFQRFITYLQEKRNILYDKLGAIFKQMM
jgi:hypothetical protein